MSYRSSSLNIYFQVSLYVQTEKYLIVGVGFCFCFSFYLADKDLTSSKT